MGGNDLKIHLGSITDLGLNWLELDLGLLTLAWAGSLLQTSSRPANADRYRDDDDNGNHSDDDDNGAHDNDDRDDHNHHHHDNGPDDW